MPESKAPGVYITEVADAGRSIEGVDASTACFVGVAPLGPVESPVELRSVAQLLSTFGRPGDPTSLPTVIANYFDNGGQRCFAVRVAPSSTTEDYRRALTTLDTVEVSGLLVVPGAIEATDDLTLAIAASDYATARGMVLILDAPPPTGEEFEQLAAAVEVADALRDRANTALYFPWIAVDSRVIPPCGFVAGIIARTDAAFGVWKSPAGIDAGLRGATGLAVEVDDDTQNDLNPRGVNCVRAFEGYGILLWGARTLAPDSDWKYLAVRRLALYIEASLRRGTQWVAFEPNAEPLWAAVSASVSAFMTGLWSAGAMQGATSDRAFQVRCDRSTMSQADIDAGRLVFMVAFAPLRPAEFLVLTITQRTAAAPR